MVLQTGYFYTKYQKREEADIFSRYVVSNAGLEFVWIPGIFHSFGAVVAHHALSAIAPKLARISAIIGAKKTGATPMCGAIATASVLVTIVRVGDFSPNKPARSLAYFLSPQRKALTSLFTLPRKSPLFPAGVTVPKRNVLAADAVSHRCAASSYERPFSRSSWIEFL